MKTIAFACLLFSLATAARAAGPIYQPTDLVDVKLSAPDMEGRAIEVHGFLFDVAGIWEIEQRRGTGPTIYLDMTDVPRAQMRGLILDCTNQFCSAVLRGTVHLIEPWATDEAWGIVVESATEGPSG